MFFLLDILDINARSLDIAGLERFLILDIQWTFNGHFGQPVQDS